MYVLRRCLFGLIAIVATGLMVASCESVNKLSNLTGPTPDLAPTFSSIQLAVIQSSGSNPQRCIACHTSQGRNPAAGLDLSANAFSGLVNVASRNKPGATLVVPGDPDNSYVIQKLEGATGIVGRQMPFNGPPYLTAGQIQIIRRWILLGAKND
ncbi:MAG: hypothetical protein DMF95_05530 [Acidobacteria bacterium]|nr:MAG: hypothetical protein DMF96_09675 [Acidobacteriota bacterium]PYR20263.1 MAG: hypothetical protein DMF94_12530 [Acidobacteriota bacterium]PYR52922.1 MAG: hypothetical protein DMF95_05530 [Acidobacteriota bacterium]